MRAILRAAVGQPGTGCEAKPCICDMNVDGKITIVDALLALRIVVGWNPCLIEPWYCPFPCNCPIYDEPPCTSARITTAAGSNLDYGWTGVAHDAPLLLGGAITARVKRECSGSVPDVECEHDDDCSGNGVCLASCDCNDDTSCEVTGPTHEQKCLTTLADCVADRCIVSGSTTATVCETNADCGAGTCTGSIACAPGVPCVHTFGPPLPQASGATPICIVTYFDGPLTGTADSGTGETLLSASLRSRIYLGNAGVEKPCPVCGAPEQDPKPGDVFTCDGGLFNGASCTVEGVSPVFGGTSCDCPPTPRQFSSTLAIRFNEVTTGTSTRTAQLPCKFFGFTANPTVPGSNPKCLDKVGASDPVCSSNSDCMRCTEETSTTCTNNADCAGSGTCAEAPDQPVTCGYWCNCGLCGGDPLLPCFGDEDCPGETTCEVGPGTGTQASAPQTRSNNCSNDKFICGGDGIAERCETTLLGTCSQARYYPCESDADCENQGAGVCVIEPRPCFEPRITRSGEPSPLGKYCAVEDKTCDTNADCTGQDDLCVEDASRPRTAALFCVATSASAAVNSAVGIMGPGAIVQKSLVEVCRCGDSELGCDEECDDGNTGNGDGCDDLCQGE
ncbi:MAG: hypothetical protein ABR587_00910 [Candidatus Binatia bacterium]